METVIQLKPIITLNEYIDLERTNKFGAADKKREETDAVAWQIKTQKIPAFEKITKIIFIWKHRNRRKDLDNVEFSQKFIRDGLVVAGVVRNDTWQYFPTTTIHKHLVDKKHPGCEVHISGPEYQKE